MKAAQEKLDSEIRLFQTGESTNGKNPYTRASLDASIAAAATATNWTGSVSQVGWYESGTPALTRPDTYTVTIPSTVAPGQATFQAGQVTLAGSGAITAATLTIASPATLVLTSDQVAASTLVVNSGILEVGNGGTTGTLGGGAVTDNGTLVFKRV